MLHPLFTDTAGLLLFRLRRFSGAGSLWFGQTKLRKLGRVAEPGNASATGAHPCVGIDETVFKRPKLRFLGNEINQARPSNFAFDQFRVPADRTDLARFIQILFAVTDRNLLLRARQYFCAPASTGRCAGDRQSLVDGVPPLRPPCHN